MIIFVQIQMVELKLMIKFLNIFCSAVLCMIIFVQIQMVESKLFCDCYASDGRYPFNADCLDHCYFNYSATSPCAPPKGSWEEAHELHKSYYNCVTFLQEYFKIRHVGSPLVGPKRVVDILDTPSSTVISLNADMKMRYSMSGMSTYTCKISTLEVTPEKDVLKKCYHYSEHCPVSPTVLSPLFGAVGELATHKACLISLENKISSFSLMNPVSVNITGPTAVKTECKVGYSSLFNESLSLVSGWTQRLLYEIFVTIEFPLELKSLKIYSYSGDPSLVFRRWNHEFPTSDIDLELHVTTLSNNTYAVDLSWTCPSNWNGQPDFYRVTCARIPAPTNETNDSCANCWDFTQFNNQFNFSDNLQLTACLECFHTVAYHLEIPQHQSGMLDAIANKPFIPRNFKDKYIGYPAEWHSHSTTFIIQDCGFSCDNSTAEKINSRSPVWPNSNVMEMKFMCIVDTINKLTRNRSVRWAWNGVKEYLEAVTVNSVVKNMGFGRVGSQTPKKYIQLQYREPANKEACRLLLLESLDDKYLLEFKEQKDIALCQPTMSPDITFIFPPEIRRHQKVNLGSNVGCYDWLSQTWYFPMKTSLFNESTEFIDDGTSFVIVPTIYEPINVYCLPSKSLVVWTSQETLSNNSRNTIETAIIKMESGRLDVKLTLYSKLSDFLGCLSETSLLSTDIDVHSRPGYVYIIVLTSSGLWNISMETAFCQLVVNSSTIMQHVRTLSNIKSFTLFSSTKIFFILLSDLNSVFQYNFSDIWLPIDKYFKPFTVLAPEMQEELPGFPSHSVQIFNFSNIEPIAISTATFLNHARELSEECFFPTLSEKNGGKMQFQMLSKTTANVTVYPIFSSSYCDGFRKPPLMYQIRYGIISKNNNVSHEHYACTHEKCPCDDPAIGPCRITNTDSTRQQVISLSIGHLIPDQNYIFEVSAKLKLNAQYLNPLSGIHDKYFDYQNNFFEGSSETKLRSTIIGAHETKYQPPSALSAGKIVVGVSVPILVLIAILISGVVFVYKKQWYMYKNLNRIHPTDIITIEKLGEGHFGEVWKANLKIKGRLVFAAVKQLNEAAQEKERRQFLEEAIVLSKLKHSNIIQVLGICMSAKPALLALEFMDGGSVQSFLRRTDVRDQLNFIDLLFISLQVCKACTYLEENGYIHRDISAKNCLISLHQNSLLPKVVKLADFGLAKDISSNAVYTNIDDPVIPVLYTAPEGILKSQFSSKGDVWSFGILLWEIFTWGASPYGKCFTTQGNEQNCTCKAYSVNEVQYLVCLNRNTLNNLSSPCFNLLTRDLKDLLDQCWKYEPEERPTFLFVRKYIQTLYKRKQTTNSNSPKILRKPIQQDSTPNHSSVELHKFEGGSLNNFTDNDYEIPIKTSSEMVSMSSSRANSSLTSLQFENAYCL